MTRLDRSTEDLVPLVYAQLRRYARQVLRREAPGQTLQPTALVHEAFLRLVQGEPEWQGPAHFLHAGARTMRRILVDRARRRGRERHGGDRERRDLSTELAQTLAPDAELLALDEALERFERLDPRRSEVVHLRHFVGLSLEETAQVLGVSLSTVKADWVFARAWLKRALERDAEE